MVKADAQSDGILMRLWEATRSVSGTLMNGVNGLTEGTPESSLTPSPYGDPASRRPPWARQRALGRQWTHWHMDLGLSASRSARSAFLLFTSHPAWEIWYSRWADCVCGAESGIVLEAGLVRLSSALTVPRTLHYSSYDTRVVITVRTRLCSSL